MPPSDYSPVETLGLLPLTWFKLRTWWRNWRLRKQDHVEGHRVLDK
jgi:hypothetical protein